MQSPRTRRRLLGWVALGLALGRLTTPAAAQHADIYPFNDSGQISVAQYNYDQGAVMPTGVFSGRFDTFYSVNNPGFTTEASGSSLPGSAALEWDFLPMTTGGVTSTLLYWDGLGAEAAFGPTPTDAYEFSLYGRDGPATADGGDQLVVGNVIDVTSPGGALHEHRYYFLDDNGDGTNNTLPEAGYYLVAMRLRIADLEASDPFFMVWGTPDSSSSIQTQLAVPWVQDRTDLLVGGGLPGDFNGDGMVNAADYTVWRDDAGATYQASDYDLWTANYGASPGATSGTTIPEPASVVLFALAAAVFCAERGRATPFR